VQRDTEKYSFLCEITHTHAIARTLCVQRDTESKLLLRDTESKLLLGFDHVSYRHCTVYVMHHPSSNSLVRL
jgi:hypothetical protein